MLFNSTQFLIFFPIVFIFYHLLDHKSQNQLLLIASYIFYGAWDYRFLSLLMFTTLMDYGFSLVLDGTRSDRIRKLCLWISVVANLGILGFFKYFNFFAENLVTLFAEFGIKADLIALNIVLPLGISFYTFQSMSYTIDVYRRRLRAERNLIDFALYVSFFPQLVAGPIERADRLLPQVKNRRVLTLSKCADGLWLVLRGFVKKVVIADNLAYIADAVFSQEKSLSGVATLLGVYAFAFQIYCDFSGYSDIARGLAKWLGFELMVNFETPYLARNPSEFWRRWHISLSTWLRDYLYIPLGGNRLGPFRNYLNLMITMLLGGLWHGASWTFIVWGAYHGVLLMTYRFYTSVCEKINRSIVIPIKLSPRVAQLIHVFVTFQFVCMGWIFFRSQTLEQALRIYMRIFRYFDFGQVLTVLFQSTSGGILVFGSMALSLLLFSVYECIDPDQPKWQTWFRRYPILRLFACSVALYLIYIGGVVRARQFIYFQF